MSRTLTGFSGLVYRIHAADKAALDTAASKNFGGRWNRANRFGVFYASLTKETAQAEYASQLRKRGLTLGNLSPRLMTTIRVRLTNVLDLANPDRQEEFGISKSELEPDEDVCLKKILEVSDRARAQGYEGILSSSARLARGKNLNIFPDKLSPKSFLRIIKSERLRTKTGNS